MAPLYSDKYVIKEVLGNGWTYVLTPENGKLREKIRHYNELKEVCRGKDEEETPNIHTGKDEDDLVKLEITIPPWKPKFKSTNKDSFTDGKKKSQEETQVLRRSSRKKIQTKRLVIESLPGKRYAEKAIPLAEDSESEVEQEMD